MAAEPLYSHAARLPKGESLRLAMIALVLLLNACVATAQDRPRPMPDWLSGYWLACEGGETVENWIGAGGETLLGTNLSGGGYEFLRIAANESGEIVYYSMPGGRSPPTEFVLTAHADRRAVFENPNHDFPKRIIYERNGDAMTARIDGGDGSAQAMEWRFRRSELNARCRS